MHAHLQFALNVEEGWPPVGSESLPFQRTSTGYECLSVPVFVKNLSVGDVLNVIVEEDGFVFEWNHVYKSGNSTVWLLRLQGDPPIQTCLRALRLMKCNTTGLKDLGCYAADIPPSVLMTDVEAVLEMLDPDFVAIAYPSLRHAE